MGWEQELDQLLTEDGTESPPVDNWEADLDRLINPAAQVEVPSIEELAKWPSANDPLSVTLPPEQSILAPGHEMQARPTAAQMLADPSLAMSPGYSNEQYLRNQRQYESDQISEGIHKRDEDAWIRYKWRVKPEAPINILFQAYQLEKDGSDAWDKWTPQQQSEWLGETGTLYDKKDSLHETEETRKRWRTGKRPIRQIGAMEDVGKKLISSPLKVGTMLQEVKRWGNWATHMVDKMWMNTDLAAAKSGEELAKIESNLAHINNREQWLREQGAAPDIFDEARRNNPYLFGAERGTWKDWGKKPHLIFGAAAENLGYVGAYIINPALPYALGIGEVYGELRKAGADPEWAVIGAGILGPIYAYVETAQIKGFKALAGLDDGAKSGLVQGLSRRVIKDLSRGKLVKGGKVLLPRLRSIVMAQVNAMFPTLQALIKTGGGIVREGGEEVVQSLLVEGGKVVFAGKSYTAEEWEDYKSQLVNEFMTGMAAGGVLGGIGATARFSSELVANMQDKKNSTRAMSMLRDAQILLASGANAEESLDFITRRYLRGATEDVTSLLGPKGPVPGMSQSGELARIGNVARQATIQQARDEVIKKAAPRIEALDKEIEVIKARESDEKPLEAEDLERIQSLERAKGGVIEEAALEVGLERIRKQEETQAAEEIGRTEEPAPESLGSGGEAVQDARIRQTAEELGITEEEANVLLTGGLTATQTDLTEEQRHRVQREQEALRIQNEGRPEGAVLSRQEVTGEMAALREKSDEDLDTFQQSWEDMDEGTAEARQDMLSLIHAERVRRAGQLAQRDAQVARLSPQQLTSKQERLQAIPNRTAEQDQELQAVENRLQEVEGEPGEATAQAPVSLEQVVPEGETQKQTRERLKGLSDGDLLAHHQALQGFQGRTGSNRVKLNQVLAEKEIARRGLTPEQAGPAQDILRRGDPSIAPHALVNDAAQTAKRRAALIPVTTIGNMDLALVPSAHRRFWKVLQQVPGIRDIVVRYNTRDYINPLTGKELTREEALQYVSPQEKAWYDKNPQFTPQPAALTTYNDAAKGWEIDIYPSGQADPSVPVHETLHTVVGSLRGINRDVTNSMDYWARRQVLGAEEELLSPEAREEAIVTALTARALGESGVAQLPADVLSVVDALWADMALTPAQKTAVHEEQLRISAMKDAGLDPHSHSGLTRPKGYNNPKVTGFKMLPAPQQDIAKYLGTRKPGDKLRSGFLHTDGSFSELGINDVHFYAAESAGTSLEDYWYSGGLQIRKDSSTAFTVGVGTDDLGDYLREGGTWATAKQKAAMKNWADKTGSNTIFWSIENAIVSNMYGEAETVDGIIKSMRRRAGVIRRSVHFSMIPSRGQTDITDRLVTQAQAAIKDVELEVRKLALLNTQQARLTEELDKLTVEDILTEHPHLLNLQKLRGNEREIRKFKKTIEFARAKSPQQWVTTLKTIGKVKPVEWKATGLEQAILDFGEARIAKVEAMAKEAKASLDQLEIAMKEVLGSVPTNINEVAGDPWAVKMIQRRQKLSKVAFPGKKTKARIPLSEIAHVVDLARPAIVVQRIRDPESQGREVRDYNSYAIDGDNYVHITFHWTPDMRAPKAAAQVAIDEAVEKKETAEKKLSTINDEMNEKYKDHTVPKPDRVAMGLPLVPVTEEPSLPGMEQIAARLDAGPSVDELIGPDAIEEGALGQHRGSIGHTNYIAVPVPSQLQRKNPADFEGATLVGVERDDSTWVLGVVRDPNLSEEVEESGVPEDAPRSIEELVEKIDQLWEEAEEWSTEQIDEARTEARDRAFEDQWDEYEDRHRREFVEAVGERWEEEGNDADDFDEDDAEEEWNDDHRDDARQALREEIETEYEDWEPDDVGIHDYLEIVHSSIVDEAVLEGWSRYWSENQVRTAIGERYFNAKSRAITDLEMKEERYRIKLEDWQKKNDPTNPKRWHHVTGVEPADSQRPIQLRLDVDRADSVVSDAQKRLRDLEAGYRYRAAHYSGLEGNSYRPTPGGPSIPLKYVNLAGHVRSTDHSGESGEYVYFFQEAQSDYNQTIRRIGLAGDPGPDIKPEHFYILRYPRPASVGTGAESIRYLNEFFVVGPHEGSRRGGLRLRSFSETGEGQALLMSYVDAMKRKNDMKARRARRGSSSSTPGVELPWSGTEGISHVLNKLAVMDAAEAGADWIALVNGDIQIARNHHDVAKAMGMSLEYDKREPDSFARILREYGVTPEIIDPETFLPRREQKAGRDGWDYDGYNLRNGRWAVTIDGKTYSGRDIALGPVTDPSIPAVREKIQRSIEAGESLDFYRWPVYGIYYKKDAAGLDFFRTLQDKSTPWVAGTQRVETEMERALSNTEQPMPDNTPSGWLKNLRKVYPDALLASGLGQWLQGQAKINPDRVITPESVLQEGIVGKPTSPEVLLKTFEVQPESDPGSQADVSRNRAMEYLGEHAKTAPLVAFRLTEDVRKAIRKRMLMFKMVPHEADRGRLQVDMAEKIRLRKPVSSRAVVREIQRQFPEVPIRGMATHLPRKALGWYDIKNTGIRMKDISSITTGAHEIAHHIDHGLTQSISSKPPNQAVQEELVQLGKWLYGNKRPKGGYASEGFAEFVRMYLTGDNTQQETPALHEWFTKHFLRGHQEIAKRLGKIKRIIGAFQAQGAIQRGRALINRKPIRGTLKDVWDRVSLRFLTDWRDEFSGLKREMRKGGIWETLPAHKDPYKLLVYFASKAGARARQFVLEGTVDLWGNPTGISLRQAMAPLQGKKSMVDDWTVYSIHKRAQHLFTRGIQSGPSEADTEYIVNHFEETNPEFKRVLKDVTAWNHRLLDFVVESGGMSKEVADLMKAMNPVYVPFFRAFAEGELKSVRKSSGGQLTSKKVPVHRIGESRREIIDPIESMIAQAERLIGVAQRAAVGKALTNLSLQPKMAGLIWEVPAPKKATNFKASQILPDVRRLLEEKFGLNPDEISAADLAEWGDDILTIYTNAAQYYGKDNLIPIAHDGKIRWFETSKPIFQMLMGMDQAVLPGFLNVTLGKAARGIRLGATGLNASFGLIRNFIRDIGTFTILSKYAKAGPFSATAGVVADIAKTPAAQKFKALGGKMSGQILQDRTATQHLRGELLASTLGKKAVVHVVHPIQAIRELLGITEAGTRIGEFQAALKQLEEKYGKGSARAAVEAFNAGQDVTTNFTRHGRIAKHLNLCIPFFNAAIQGPDKILRSLRERPIQTTVRAISTLSLLGVYLWLKNRDEEWYKNASTHEKVNYFHITKDDDTVIRLPVPFELGHIFASIPVAAMDALYNEDPERFMDAMGEVLDRANPFGNRNPLKGIAGIGTYIEIAENLDWAGRPIVPARIAKYKPVPPEYEFTPYTTEITKAIGRVLKVSPIKLEYAINSLSGGLYRRTVSGAEKLAKQAEFEPQKSDIPVAGTLFMRSPQEPRRQKQKFFDRFDDLTKKHNAEAGVGTDEQMYKRYKKTHEALQRWLKSMPHRKTLKERNFVHKKVSALLERHAQREEMVTGKRPW